MPPRSWTLDEEEILIDNYDKCTCEEILKLLTNKTKQQIQDKMYKNGLTLSKDNHSKSKRKYTLNTNYFKTFSSNMAYILGLWWSDGSICPSPTTKELYEFNITLLNEQELLEQINLELGSNIPLKIHNKTGANVLKIFSTTLCQTIIDLGGMQNKSLLIGWPKIPKEYYKDFIRGYFDGDGGICQKTKGTFVSYFVSGSLDFIIELQNKIYEIDNNICGYLSTIKNTHRLNLNQRETIELAQLLYYKQDIFYIKRKYDKFIELYNQKVEEIV
jgi:hypothetical protein